MLGCVSAAAASTSRTMRPDMPRPSPTTLRATGRSRTASQAAYTSAKPPLPILRRSW